MESNVFKYIWTHSRSQQLWILGVILLSMPTYFMSLDLPKQIVNGPIQGKGWPEGEGGATIMRFTLGLPDSLGGELVLLPGFEASRLTALIVLSLLFLLLVFVNGWFKQYINTYKGRVGEAMLRRLRYDLIDRVLRFPLGHFKRVRASEVATMVKDEVEPLGGFIGDAFVQPVFLGSQALTALLFIIFQSFWLGLIAVAIVLVQAFLIPRLRRRLIALSRERQVTARELAGRVGEVVDGITTIRTNDTSNYERADFARRLGRIFDIRFALYQRKFFAKGLNNFLTQLTPFLFYLIGGYFALSGHLDIGQLVAVIAAYKDLPSPIKELIDWDQQRLDVQVKYTQVIDQFNVEGMLPAELQKPVFEPVAPLTGDIEASGLAIADDSGAKLLDQVSFRLPVTQRIALVGPVNSGAEALAEALGRIVGVSSGRLAIGGRPITDMPEALTGRRIAYIGPDAYVANGTLRDAILYGLRNVPRKAPELDPGSMTARQRELSLARSHGNTDLDVAADWIDYEAIGASGPKDVNRLVKQVLATTDLAGDVKELGLRGALDPEREPELCRRLLEARRQFRARLEGSKLARYIEPFDPSAYNRQATIGENVLFGTPMGPDLAGANLAANPHFQRVVGELGLDGSLFGIGKSLAATAVELFAGLSADNPLLDQLSFMTPEQLPEFQAALARVSAAAIPSAADRGRFITLALNYVERRHRLGHLDEAMEARLVEARRRLREGLPEELRQRVSFYDPDTYNAAASLQDNILFGRVVHDLAEAPQRIRGALDEVLEKLELKTAVLEVGLGFGVGFAGKRLTAVQRQKLALARALLKRPDLLIVNRGLAAMDGPAQAAILAKVLAAAAGGGGQPPFGVIWVLSGPEQAARFDQVLAFRNGKMVQQGRPAEVLGQDGALVRDVA